MDKNKSIEALQFFMTGLSEGAFVHKVQGDIFKEYLKDEEDLYWYKGQFELIKNIGEQNWLISQM